MSSKQHFQLVLHIVVLLGVFLILGRPVWNVVVFPHEDHPYSLIALGTLVVMFPPSVWWRWFRNSKSSQNLEAAIAALVIAAGYAVIGLSFCLVFRAVFRPAIGGPESGEIIAFSFIFAIAGFVSGLILVCLPLALDSTFFSHAARHTFWLSLVVLIPTLATAALVVGPRMDWLFA